MIEKINNTAPKTSPILEVWLVFFPCKSLRLDVFLGSLHLCQWVLGLISSPSPFTTSELCSTLGIGIQGCLPANPTFAPRNRQPYSGTVNHDPGPFITAVLGLISREGGWHWKSAPSNFHDNRASQKSSKHHRCLPVGASPHRNSSGHMQLIPSISRGVGTCSSEEEPKSHWVQVLMSEKHQD